jgi:hypothetical protein
MTTNESNLPALRSNAALPVRNMEELAVAGNLLAQSGMFGIQNAAAGFVVAATCHQQGITLMDFRRTYHIVDGTPSMRADAMLAEFHKIGGKHKILEISLNRASVELEIDGEKFESAFTMDDAKRTGDCFNGDGKTLKHNWAHRPDDMLWARAVSRGVRRLRPGIVAGLYTPEEVQDFNDAKPVRAAAPIAPEEAARRVEATVVPPTTTAPTFPDEFICPALGSEFDGKPWADLTTETLEGALLYEGPELTEEHKAAIRLTLDQRDTEGCGA